MSARHSRPAEDDGSNRIGRHTIPSEQQGDDTPIEQRADTTEGDASPVSVFPDDASTSPQDSSTPARLSARGRARLRVRTADLVQAREDIRQNLHSNRRIVLIVLALVFFYAVLQNMLAGDILRLDYYAYRIFVVRMRRAWLTPIMQSISELALPAVLVVMLLAVHAFAPGRSPGLCAACNLVGVVLLNQVFKFIVQRPRPEGFRLIAESGYSFPSGHSMVAMAFYGLLAWMAWRYERDPLVRHISMAGFGLVVMLVGISRVYLGVHYASDVLAGLLLSTAWLALYTKVVAPIFLPDQGTNLGADKTGFIGTGDGHPSGEH